MKKSGYPKADVLEKVGGEATLKGREMLEEPQLFWALLFEYFQPSLQTCKGASFQMTPALPHLMATSRVPKPEPPGRASPEVWTPRNLERLYTAVTVLSHEAVD